MATALANAGVLGTEFLSSRVGDNLSSKQKSGFVSLNSTGFTISSRSAAFLSVVAFAGRQVDRQGSSEGTKKKPYFKKRRSKKNGAVAKEVKNDLRALISNSAIPVFSEGAEVSEEPEVAQLSEDDVDAVLDSGTFAICAGIVMKSTRKS